MKKIISILAFLLLIGFVAYLFVKDDGNTLQKELSDFAFEKLLCPNVKYCKQLSSMNRYRHSFRRLNRGRSVARGSGQRRPGACLHICVCDCVCTLGSIGLFVHL